MQDLERFSTCLHRVHQGKAAVRILFSPDPCTQILDRPYQFIGKPCGAT
jgi:hypothetical protein